MKIIFFLELLCYKYFNDSLLYNRFRIEEEIDFKWMLFCINISSIIVVIYISLLKNNKVERIKWNLSLFESKLNLPKWLFKYSLKWKKKKSVV